MCTCERGRARGRVCVCGGGRDSTPNHLPPSLPGPARVAWRINMDQMCSTGLVQDLEGFAAVLVSLLHALSVLSEHLPAAIVEVIATMLHVSFHICQLDCLDKAKGAIRLSGQTPNRYEHSNGTGDGSLATASFGVSALLSHPHVFLSMEHF